MEENISNWKNLWSEKKTTPIDLKKLVAQLTKIESKNKRERTFVIIVFPLTILLLTLILPVFQNMYHLTALLSIATGMFMILWQLHRGRIRRDVNEGSLDNKEFLQNTITQLNRQLLITSKYMWVYTILILIGINTAYLEILKELNSPVRISVHLILTTSIMIFMYSGIKKRNDKNRIEISPFIDMLRELNTV